MQTIPLDQLEKMFAEMRTEESSIDGEMLWGYYFTAPEAAALEPVAEALGGLGYELEEIAQNDDETFVLPAQKFEKHTPETLFARNAELDALAGRFPGVEYDGMEVDAEEEPACCGGHGEDHECCGGHGEDHECCGGHGEDHECCSGHGGEEEDHECCGGHGGSGCCGRHHQPIENPQLLAAIERIAKDHTEEAQAQITLALQQGLYLVPVFKQTDPESPDESVQVLVCTDDKNAEYLPLFTDEAALKAWTQEPVAAMVLNAPEAWNFIMSQPECAGAVINPAGTSLPINREMVAILKRMIDAHQQQAE